MHIARLYFGLVSFKQKIINFKFFHENSHFPYNGKIPIQKLFFGINVLFVDRFLKILQHV